MMKIYILIIMLFGTIMSYGQQGIQIGDSPIYHYNENVGIGTTSPSEKLQIVGRIKAVGIYHTEGTFNYDNKSIQHYGLTLWADGYGYLSSYYGLTFFTSGQDRLKILKNGNVGIGITNPTYKLSVDGTISAKEVKVSTTPNSDYVFEPDYELKPLHEVDQFIQQNKHLPDIPSAEEFKENGVGLGEMDNMLLRKVEELTLYVIELRKENEELKQENHLIKSDLFEEIETIKAQLK